MFLRWKPVLTKVKTESAKFQFEATEGGETSVSVNRTNLDEGEEGDASFSALTYIAALSPP